MTNKEKALSIAESTVSERTRSLPANQIQKIIVRDACLEMAAWKQEQLIEKACEWLKENASKYIYDREVSRYKEPKLTISGKCWEDFKKAMEGE